MASVVVLACELAIGATSVPPGRGVFGDTVHVGAATIVILVVSGERRVVVEGEAVASVAGVLAET